MKEPHADHQQRPNLSDIGAGLRQALGPLEPKRAAEWGAFLDAYRARLRAEGMPLAERRALQDGANPCYIPRNALMQDAIKAAEAGSFKEVRVPRARVRVRLMVRVRVRVGSTVEHQFRGRSGVGKGSARDADCAAACGRRMYTSFRVPVMHRGLQGLMAGRGWVRTGLNRLAHSVKPHVAGAHAARHLGGRGGLLCQGVHGMQPRKAGGAASLPAAGRLACDGCASSDALLSCNGS